MKLASRKNAVYAAGKIRLTGVDSLQAIVKWDGNAWSVLPMVSQIDSVIDMIPFGDSLAMIVHVRYSKKGQNSFTYLAGDSLVGGSSANGGNALTADGGRVFVSGAFAGSRENIPLYQFSGDRGAPMLPESHGLFSVRSLAVHGDYLYVAGRFSAINGKPAYNLVRWKIRSGNGVKPTARNTVLTHGEVFGFFRGDLSGWEVQPNGVKMDVFDISGRHVLEMRGVYPGRSVSPWAGKRVSAGIRSVRISEEKH